MVVVKTEGFNLLGYFELFELLGIKGDWELSIYNLSLIIPVRPEDCVWFISICKNGYPTFCSDIFKS